MEELQQKFSLNPLEAASQVEKLPAFSSLPEIEPQQPESMAAYSERLKCEIDSSKFEVVQSIDSDGLYIGKRAIIGAEGQGQLLNQAGTVFHHVLIYVRTEGKTQSLEYGPEGSADVTRNVMDAVPCGPIFCEDAQPETECPLLKIKADYTDIKDTLVQQAIAFAQSRKYHAIHNNCIKNTDFLCRVLTKGVVRNIPMIYDTLAGKVPQQDHPMLLMFFLMTQISWFDVCDGSKLTGEFMALSGNPKSQQRSSIDFPQELISSAEDVRISEKEIDLQAVLSNIAAIHPDLANASS